MSGIKIRGRHLALFALVVYAFYRFSPIPLPSFLLSSGDEEDLAAGWSRHDPARPDAVITLLFRKDKLYSELLPALENFELRFNDRLGYPYALLCEDEIDDEFALRQVERVTRGKAQIGLLTPKFWAVPKAISQKKLDYYLGPPTGGVQIGLNGEKIRMPTGHDDWFLELTQYFSIHYRQMCRFWTGLFYDHPLLEPYEWIWRLDGDIRFNCALETDPVAQMIEGGHLLGYAQTSREDARVVSNLLPMVYKFIEKHRSSFQSDTFDWIVDEEGVFKLNIFYTNFEITNRRKLFAENDLWHEFWKEVEKAKGIYYRRWGDAPLHTLFFSAFLPRSQIVYFNDTGYVHDESNGNQFICPPDPLRCVCDTRAELDPLTVELHQLAEEWWPTLSVGAPADPEL